MSQYDLETLFATEATVELTWHGEDTLVRIGKEDEKKVVKKGDTIEVDVEQARSLMFYSDLWTLKGDKPVDQPFRRAQLNALKAQDARNKAAVKTGKKEKAATDEKTEDAPVVPLTEDEVEHMEDKKVIVTALETRKVKFNKRASVADLKVILMEIVKKENAGVPKMVKHVVTQVDLDKNPDLEKQGVKLGDEIEIPEVDDTNASANA